MLASSASSPSSSSSVGLARASSAGTAIRKPCSGAVTPTNPLSARRRSAPALSALPWKSGSDEGEATGASSSSAFSPRLSQRAFSALAGACVAVCAALHPPAAASAAEVLRMSASENPEIFEAQKTLVQSWSIVRDSFVDASKDGFARKWEGELASALARTAQDDATNDVEAAYGEIGAMLRTIGDPYTRFVNPKEFQDFSLKNDGELQVRQHSFLFFGERS